MMVGRKVAKPKEAGKTSEGKMIRTRLPEVSEQAKLTDVGAELSASVEVKFGIGEGSLDLGPLEVLVSWRETKKDQR